MSELVASEELDRGTRTTSDTGEVSDLGRPGESERPAELCRGDNTVESGRWPRPAIRIECGFTAVWLRRMGRDGGPIDFGRAVEASFAEPLFDLTTLTGGVVIS